MQRTQSKKCPGSKLLIQNTKLMSGPNINIIFDEMNIDINLDSKTEISTKGCKQDSIGPCSQV